MIKKNYAMPDKTWKRMISKQMESLDAYVNKFLFDKPVDFEEIFREFRELDWKLKDKKGTKGIISSTDYSLDVDSILEEVRIWGKLAADDYLERIPEENKEMFSRDYIGDIIAGYVLKKVQKVIEQTPENLKNVSHVLFMRLPNILRAETKPATGGFIGMVFSTVGRKREFKPYLMYHPGESLEELDKECRRTLDRLEGLSKTGSYSLKSYITIADDFDKDEYSRFTKNSQVNGFISALDDKLKQTIIFNAPEDELELQAGISDLISTLVSDSRRAHRKLFNENIKGLNRIIHDCDEANTAPEKLVSEMRDYLASHRNFYLEEIMAGNTMVERFEHPDIIKRVIQKGHLSDERFDDLTKKEKAYVSVLTEMRTSSFNDKCYEPLAEMLLAQEGEADYVGLAFAYAFYVSNHEGNHGCLKGMEKESIKIKTKVMEILIYNADNMLNDKAYCEDVVRGLVMQCRTEKEKLGALEDAKKQMKEVKEMYE